MKKNQFLFALSALLCTISCGKDEPKIDLVDFEDLELEADSFWNGSDGSGGFQVGNVSFPNNYNADWKAWIGFSYSNVKDADTQGYANQYAAIAGEGAGGSDNYAIFFTYSSDTLTFQTPEKITNISFCNSTYAYHVMKEGDPVFQIPKMGGEDGTSPDYLKLLIRGIDESGELVLDGYLMLADFDLERTPAGSYIANGWTDLDLSDFGYLKQLVLSFESNIRDDFGILIPTYVCLDNIEGKLQILD